MIEKLASSLGRRDEVPNQELAREIADNTDQSAIKALFENLSHKNKDIQNDCIKVIYEIGMLNPKLIAGYPEELIRLLDNKNNRLQWGGMMALNTIVFEKPETVYQNLPKLVEIAEKGTVITKDNLMAILVKLYSVASYSEQAYALLIEQLLKSLPNQLPMYAENILPVIAGKDKDQLIATLTSRLGDIEKDTKRARVEKVIKKLSK